MSKSKPFLSKIIVYPIKSLDGVEVSEARVFKGGGLEYDREFAMYLTSTGKLINGKTNSKVHLVSSGFDLKKRTILLGTKGNSDGNVFHLDRDREDLEGWLSSFFGSSVTLKQDPKKGFPDDTDASGPTIIGHKTIREVSSWFDGITPDEMRARLRTNIEIGNVHAFWEDRLFGATGTTVNFEVGNSLFEGVNPCQRCVTPSRNPYTGEVYHGFKDILLKKRRETLPDSTDIGRFNHFYRLAVNTKTLHTGVIAVGDKINIL